MNEQLTQRLDGILSILGESAKTAGNFAVEQAPDVVQQLLLWKFWENIILIPIVLVPLVLIVVVWKKHLYWCIKEDDVDKWFQFAMLNVIYIPSIVFLFALIIDGILSVVEITIAPKLYLLEYASSLLK